MKMNATWKRFSLMLVVAILTIASVATMVHRHTGGDDQGCVLCCVRHEPAIENKFIAVLFISLREERLLEVIPVRAVIQEAVSERFGRAPPAKSFFS